MKHPGDQDGRGEDLAVITVMTVVPVLLVISVLLAAIAIGRMPRQGRRAAYVITGATLVALMIAGLAGTFWFWGVGFDYADTYRQPPEYVEPVMLLSFSVAGAAYAGFLVTGLLAHRGSRRPTPTG
jgi:hypothetical protein